MLPNDCPKIPETATKFVAHYMPARTGCALLRGLLHCSLDKEPPALGDPDLTGDEGSAAFKLIMCAAPFAAGFNPKGPIWRAEFFGGGASGPYILLWEDADTEEMVHLIAPHASEALIRLGKILIAETYAAMTGKAA